MTLSLKPYLAQLHKELVLDGVAECLPLPATSPLAQRVDLWQW